MKPDDPHKHLGAALGRIASGLFVVSVRRGEVQTGILASWVQQCSFQPPRVSLAVQTDREIVKLLADGAAFILNILADAQTDMIAHFGKGFALHEDAFAGLEVQSTPVGPVLSEALAYLECRVHSRLPAGDHDLILADVTAGRLLDEGQPMVHIRKNGFHY